MALNLSNLRDRVKKDLTDDIGFVQRGKLTPIQGYRDLPFTLSQQGINRQKQYQMTNADLDRMNNMVAKKEQIYKKLPAGGEFNPGAELVFNVPIQEKGASPKLRTPWYGPSGQSDPELVRIRDKVLSRADIRPAAREYLSKVPVSFGQVPPGADASAPNARRADRKIVFNPSFKDKLAQGPVAGEDPKQKRSFVSNPEEEVLKIMEHELLHQSPKRKQLEDYTPDNQKMQTYKQRWAMYTEAPDEAFIEEMFAEGDLPPEHYWHIYKQVRPNATPNDFLSNITSVISKLL